MWCIEYVVQGGDTWTRLWHHDRSHIALALFVAFEFFSHPRDDVVAVRIVPIEHPENEAFTEVE